MGKLEITEDILAPSDTIKLRFRVPSPSKTVGMTPGLIREVMYLTGKDILETDIRWDASGKNREFYGKWMGRRSEDKWSVTRIRVLIQGEQNPADKKGWAEIQLKGTVTTSYNYSNFIQRTFWWFFNRLFYHRQRQRYLENGKDDMYKMRDVFKQTFGLE